MNTDEVDLTANIRANLIFGQWNCSLVRKDDLNYVFTFNKRLLMGIEDNQITDV